MIECGCDAGIELLGGGGVEACRFVAAVELDPHHHPPVGAVEGAVECSQRGLGRSGYEAGDAEYVDGLIEVGHGIVTVLDPAGSGGEATGAWRRRRRSAVRWGRCVGVWRGER